MGLINSFDGFIILRLFFTVYPHKTCIAIYGHVSACIGLYRTHTTIYTPQKSRIRETMYRHIWECIGVDVFMPTRYTTYLSISVDVKCASACQDPSFILC